MPTRAHAHTRKIAGSGTKTRRETSYEREYEEQEATGKSRSRNAVTTSPPTTGKNRAADRKQPAAAKSRRPR